MLRQLGEIGYELGGDGAERPVLAAYYVGGEDADGQLRRHLAERLPAQWIPVSLRRLERIPLTAHGKVDEEALPPLVASELHERPDVAPEGPVEELVVELWREQLGTSRVGALSNFFELGGTSLGAIEVMVKLCRELDIELPLETLFESQTVRELSRLAEELILEDVAGLEDGEARSLGGD